MYNTTVPFRVIISITIEQNNLALKNLPYVIVQERLLENKEYKVLVLNGIAKAIGKFSTENKLSDSTKLILNTCT